MKHSPLLLLQRTVNNRFKRAQLYPGESFPHSCETLTLHETFTSSTMTMPCQRPSQKGTALSRRIISSVLCPTRFARNIHFLYDANALLMTHLNAHDKNSDTQRHKHTVLITL